MSIYKIAVFDKPMIKMRICIRCRAYTTWELQSNGEYRCTGCGTYRDLGD